MTLYIGIDWSENKHDIVMMNESGRVVVRLTIAHRLSGFLEFEQARQKTKVGVQDCVIGLETYHNLLVDFIWQQGYEQVYILPPSTTHSSRQIYKTSSAYVDQEDAELIANLLRMNRDHFRPWHPGLVLTQQIRAKVRLIQFETHQIVRLTNRLRAVLLRYYPGALKVFSALDTRIALAFIQAYPNPQAAAHLTLDEFCAFARTQHYPRPAQLAGRFARLQQDFPQADLDLITTFQDEAVCLAQQVLQAVQIKTEQLKTLQSLYLQHPDYPIYHSLPDAGDFLEPALLTLMGDDRRRFPTPNSVQVLAGTAPATEASGKRKYVAFRRACNREFRNIAQQWARASLHSSQWANAYFLGVLRHSRSTNHALRCLANRWLAILWRLWMDRQPYDEAYHLQHHQNRVNPIR